MAERDDQDKSGWTPPPQGRTSAAKSPKRSGKAEKQADREARLAAALRANLRRRKANGKD